MLELYKNHVETIANRYRAAMQKCHYDTLLLPFGSSIKKSIYDDQYYSFRSNPQALHLLPESLENSFLILREKSIECFLHEEESFWESKPSFFASFFDAFKVTKFQNLTALMKDISLPKAAMVGSAEALLPFCQTRDPKDLLQSLHEARISKTPFEIYALQEANKIAASGHKRLYSLFKESDATELELHLEYLRVTNQDEGDTPYKNIVAFNEHAGVLHHIRYEKKNPSHIHSLLVDAGATHFSYGSDITRTWIHPKSLYFSEYSSLVDSVKKAQKNIIGSIATKTNYESLHDQSHFEIARCLIENDLAKGSLESLVESNVTRTFFPHGLGHHLGLQTHDVAGRNKEPSQRNPFLRNTRDITEGDVFTIEPGIYFIPQLLQKLKQSEHASLINWKTVDVFLPMGGVRIEDNIHIQENGAVMNLTAPIGEG